MNELSREKPRLLRSKLFWVALLYFSEGFPLGLFFDLFPVYFRQQGVDLGSIGLLSLLGLSWTVKFLWAPAIDYYRHHRYWMVAVDCLMGATLIVLAQAAGFGPGVWFAIPCCPRPMTSPLTVTQSRCLIATKWVSPTACE